METTKSEQELQVLVGADEVGRATPLVSVPVAREPLATLPDGVPSMLWEEAVESERYVAAEGPTPVPGRGK